MTRYATSARTLREGASAAPTPLRTTLKGPSNQTATQGLDAPRTSLKSNASSHTSFRTLQPTTRNAGKGVTKITTRTA